MQKRHTTLWSVPFFFFFFYKLNPFKTNLALKVCSTHIRFQLPPCYLFVCFADVQVVLLKISKAHQQVGWHVPCSQGLLDTHPFPAASVSSHIARRVLRLAPGKSSSTFLPLSLKKFWWYLQKTSFSSTGRPPASHRRSLCSELKLRVKGGRGLQARSVLQKVFVSFDQYVSEPDVFA